ncbi:MAG: HlyD family type I secretion periplasmic adaptor subunit [Pseudomonadota bacterium]
MDAARFSSKTFLIIGFFALFVLIGVLGTWSVSVRLSGAVIATGIVEVESNRQVIEHSEGGVVDVISVSDGDTVEAGSPLLMLDGTFLQSELDIVASQYFELRARQQRLLAERDNREKIEISEDELADIPALRNLIDGQQNLLTVRRQNLLAEANRIDEQVEQLRAQVQGVEAQLEAVDIQSRLIQEELEDTRSLFEKGLARSTTLNALEREAANLIGRSGQLQSERARIEGQQTELKIQRLRLFTARQEEAIAELRDIEPGILELAERRLSLMERINRLTISAPVDGVVYGLQVFAERSVITAAEPLLYIVPQDQPLVVSARVNALDIDQVQVGQQVSMRFSTFDQRFTPEIFGTITKISADVFADEQTGTQFYEAELLPNQAELEKLEDVKIIPGLPVEAFIQTGERTPLHYLTKPLTDYFTRAWRES